LGVGERKLSGASSQLVFYLKFPWQTKRAQHNFQAHSPSPAFSIPSPPFSPLDGNKLTGSLQFSQNNFHYCNFLMPHDDCRPCPPPYFPNPRSPLGSCVATL